MAQSNFSFRAARLEYRARFMHAIEQYAGTCEIMRSSDDPEDTNLLSKLPPEMLRRVARFYVGNPHQASALLSIAAPLRPPPAEQFEIFVRKRPLWPSEAEASEFDCVSIDESAGRCCVHEGKAARDMSTYTLHREFALDGVFGASTDEAAMLDRVVAPLISLALDGGNASLILFGQTGCGKTHTAHTMQKFLAQRLFQSAAAEAVEVCLEVFELREKKAYDLLNERKNVRLVSDAEQRVHVLGGVKANASNADELLAVIAKAHALRSVAATERNAQSSRSHCVSRLRIGGDGGGCITLVDLAGSERNYETTQHDRAATRESADINLSLQTLKECFRATINKDVDLETIVEVGLDDVEWTRAVPKGYKEAKAAREAAEKAMGEGGSAAAAADGSMAFSAVGTRAAVPAALRNFAEGGKALHMPYRRHQLTLLLKDCFVNPSHRTVVMACVSPTATDVEHSVRTLSQVCQMRGAEEEVSRLVRVECSRLQVEAEEAMPMRKWSAKRVRQWLGALGEPELAAVAGLLPESVDGKELLQKWPASRLAHACLCGDMELAQRVYDEIRKESARVDESLAERRGRLRGFVGRADDKHGPNAKKKGSAEEVSEAKENVEEQSNGAASSEAVEVA